MNGIDEQIENINKLLKNYDSYTAGSAKKPNRKKLPSPKKALKKINRMFNIAIGLFIIGGVLTIAWVKLNPIAKDVREKNAEERIFIITKYIVENVEYNYIPGLEYNKAEDVLKRGGAVCDGYTRVFQRLAFLNGIKSDVVCGVAGTPAGSGYHAWNKVMLNGKWYWLDVTWVDMDQGDKMNMKYYLTEKLWIDHIYDEKLTRQYRNRVKELDKLIKD